MICKIPAENYEKLLEKIGKLNKRAGRSGFEAIEVRKIDEHLEQATHPLGFNYCKVYYNCEIIGESFTIKGWRLIARIEPQRETELDTGENIVREVPGRECPANYRISDMSCEHCGVKVKRNHVWVLQSEKGQYKQVGGSCFKDFFGGVDPKSILKNAERAIKITDELKEAAKPSYSSVLAVPIESFLIVVALLIRQEGFVSKGSATAESQSTASKAWDLCTSENTGQDMRFQSTDQDTAMEALDWARSIDAKSATNTYLHDLGVSCRQPYVTLRRSGYVASVISAYNNTNKVQKNDAAKTSDHIGTIKERMVLKNLLVKRIRHFDNDFGTLNYILLLDENDNQILWKTSTNADWMEEGKIVDLKLTISQHDHYNNIKQTVVNRVVQI